MHEIYSDYLGVVIIIYHYLGEGNHKTRHPAKVSDCLQNSVLTSGGSVSG